MGKLDIGTGAASCHARDGRNYKGRSHIITASPTLCNKSPVPITSHIPHCICPDFTKMSSQAWNSKGNGCTANMFTTIYIIYIFNLNCKIQYLKIEFFPMLNWLRAQGWHQAVSYTCVCHS